MRRWLFQANPDVWDLEVEVPKVGIGNAGHVDNVATRSRDGDDPVVPSKSGPQAGTYGLAEITRPLATRDRSFGSAARPNGHGYADASMSRSIQVTRKGVGSGNSDQLFPEILIKSAC
jgi:hypothetical protein